MYVQRLHIPVKSGSHDPCFSRLFNSNWNLNPDNGRAVFSFDKVFNLKCSCHKINNGLDYYIMLELK